MREHVGYLLVRLGKQAQRAFEEAIEPLNLRPPHYDLLAVAAGRAGVSQREAAAILRIDSARVVALADELSARGWLTRSTDPRDRRRNVLALTPEGKNVHTSALAASGVVQAGLVASLTDREQRQLRQLLQRLL